MKTSLKSSFIKLFLSSLNQTKMWSEKKMIKKLLQNKTQEFCRSVCLFSFFLIGIHLTSLLCSIYNVEIFYLQITVFHAAGFTRWLLKQISTEKSQFFREIYDLPSNCRENRKSTNQRSDRSDFPNFSQNKSLKWNQLPKKMVFWSLFLRV